MHLLNDNNAGKPEGIHLMIGCRPYAALGNVTGDRQILEYAKAGDGERLVMLALHDDATPEYAYGPARGLSNTEVGTFTQELFDEATMVTTMKSNRIQGTTRVRRAMVLAALLSTARVLVPLDPASAADGPFLPLPTEDQQELTARLGPGVVGRALPSSLITDVSLYFPLRDRVMTYRVTAGPNVGKVVALAVGKGKRPNGIVAWRVGLSPSLAGFLRQTESGDLIMPAVSDSGEGVVVVTTRPTRSTTCSRLMSAWWQWSPRRTSRPSGSSTSTPGAERYWCPRADGAFPAQSALENL